MEQVEVDVSVINAVIAPTIDFGGGAINISGTKTTDFNRFSRNVICKRTADFSACKLTVIQTLSKFPSLSVGKFSSDNKIIKVLCPPHCTHSEEHLQMTQDNSCNICVLYFLAVLDLQI